MSSNPVYRLLLGIAIAGLMLPVTGQNLLQNPGFEDNIAWDNHWFLSLLPPEGLTATATEDNKDPHSGSGCLEISNTKGNQWSYFYSDSLSAALKFEANKSYEIGGWIKPREAGNNAELSVNWNGSQEMLAFYSGNPDPVSHPDWFRVKDTITPSGDFTDGYLRIAFQTGKDKGKPTGKLLLDDFSVVRIPDNTETDITAFSIPQKTGPAWINPFSRTVYLEVFAETDVSTLVPDVIGLSRGATISPGVGDTVNFILPVTFTVTAQDEVTIRNWTVTVLLAPNTKTAIKGFHLDQQTGPAFVDSINHTVAAEVACGTDLTSLAPVIELSSGATVSPASEVAQDFSVPVTYTVTAEDGATTQDWSVTVTEAAPMTGTDILSFSVPGQTGTSAIDTVLHTVAAEVSSGTELTALVPEITVSRGATVSPASGVAADFTSPVIYRVTAQDGTTAREWTVTVKEYLSSETEIIHFGINGQKSLADIDTSLHTVTIEVPYGTDVTSLIPDISVSPGATVVPDSGMALDFTSPVIYTVTAQDGVTVQDWTVAVRILPNTEADIVSFVINGQEGFKTSTAYTAYPTIVVEMPYGTDVTVLAPEITVSPGATVDPAPGVVMDFTSPVVYTVTAGDGVTVRQWTVTVAVLPNTEAEILSFEVTEQTSPAFIDGSRSAIAIEVSRNTDITILEPVVRVSPGATVDPASGTAVDFSSDVVYTVTAQDGVTTREWLVAVTIDPAVGTEEVACSGNFHLYPNPASDYLTIELSSPASIVIRDLSGRIRTGVPLGREKVRVSLAGLEAGIYIAEVLGPGIRRTGRFIVR